MLDTWPAVAGYTGLSFAGAAWRINIAVEELKSGYSPLVSVSNDGNQHSSGANEGLRLLHILLESQLSVGFLVNLGVNLFLLLSLLFKVLFFGSVTLFEAQKLAERLINYALFKVLFLMAVVEFGKAGWLWLLWFAMLGFFKMFSGLARDRFERLCASPNASAMAHTRTIAVLLLVLLSDLFCMKQCVGLLQPSSISSTLLLNFEAFIIALETTQTLVQYTMHLMDNYTEYSNSGEECGGAAASALWTEWRANFLLYLNFCCDLTNLTLTLGHYFHIWWRHGLAFQVIDAVLFLNIRAVFVGILRRVQQVVNSQRALHNLRTALPDASTQELQDFNDDCAICREPMAAAKRLRCKHLFHLACLRSWLDQGAGSSCSCPTCRTPLFGYVVSPQRSPPIRSRDAPNVDPVHGGLLGQPTVQQQGFDVPDSFGEGSVEPTLLRRGSHPSQWNRDHGGLRWTSRTTSEGPVAGNRGRIRGQQWWWPFVGNRSDPSGHVEQVSGRYPYVARSLDGLRFRGQRRASQPESTVRGDGERRLIAEEARLAAMASQVEEVLPHIPRHIILQNLRRTESVGTTLENLLEAGL